MDLTDTDQSGSSDQRIFDGVRRDFDLLDAIELANSGEFYRQGEHAVGGNRSWAGIIADSGGEYRYSRDSEGKPPARRIPRRWLAAKGFPFRDRGRRATTSRFPSEPSFRDGRELHDVVALKHTTPKRVRRFFTKELNCRNVSGDSTQRITVKYFVFFIQ